jgi:CBS domain-containing protein
MALTSAVLNSPCRSPNVITTNKSLFELTAEDVMSRDVVTVSAETSMRGAARILSCARVSGAPVVDCRGRCVGVLSSADFVRRGDKAAEAAAPLPRTCPFMFHHPDDPGGDTMLCTLAPGACPFQRDDAGPGAGGLARCSEPHTVCADWQNLLTDEPPPDLVGRYMTRDVVTVRPETPLGEVARRMIDAAIHRVIVVDAGGRPIGVVSSTDLLAALAAAPAASPLSSCLADRAGCEPPDAPCPRGACGERESVAG